MISGNCRAHEGKTQKRKSKEDRIRSEKQVMSNSLTKKGVTPPGTLRAGLKNDA